MEREKHTKSGRLLEVDFYPVSAYGRKLPTRAPKTKASTAEQKKYNTKQSIKKAIRLVNANFDSRDVKLDITFSPADAPQTEDDAKRLFRNYIRRVDRARAKELKKCIEQLKNENSEQLRSRVKLLRRPLKYYCALEKKTYRTGILKGCPNWHFHLFLTGGLDRDTYEEIWGGRANANRFQPERFGPEAAARYLAKDVGDAPGKRRILRSRNLDEPKVAPPKDGKISRRGVEKLATLRIEDKEYWENRYRGYRFIRCFARLNPYNNHWYVSVVMYRCENASAELPDWTYDDWITEDF